jgi:hypothetical protein
LEGIAAGLAGGALLGAGAGALYSGVTGDGNILNSALTGGLLGAGIGGLGAAAGPTLMGTAGSAAPTAATIAGTANTPALASAALNATPAVASGSAAFGGVGGASVPAIGYEAVAPVVQGAAPVATSTPNLIGAAEAADAAGYGGTTNGVLNQVAGTAPYNPTPNLVNTAGGMKGMDILGYGLAGTAALSLLGGMNQKKLSPTTGTTPSYIRPYTYNVSQNQSAYPTTPQYGSNGLPILPTKEQNYFNQSYTAGTPYKAAAGGLMAAPPTPGLMDGGASGNVDFMGGDMYPTSQQHRSYYATPTQMPTSAQETMASYEPKTNPLTGQMTANMAKGGKSEDDGFNFDDLTKAQKEYYLDMMAAPMSAPKMPGSDIGTNSLDKYLMSQMPTGAFGRAGLSRSMDDGSNLRAGLSGIAMAQPGKHGVTAMPGNVDVGYTSARKTQDDPYLDVSAFRSINPMQGRGHAQGVNARYTMPFAVGGVTYDPVNQRYTQPSAPVATEMDGGTFGSSFGGLRPVLGGGENITTQLNPQSVAELTAQYQAQNPYKKTYDPVSQKYAAAIPDQATLMAMKNARDLQAYQAEGYATGGGIDSEYNLGSYSDGGRLLKGPGDGVSDNIPAVIGKNQPARLADGEFVIPARIVSEIGNGSTDAGAKRLYAMMDNIQAGRKKTIGKGNVAKDTKAKKHLLA